MNELSAKRRIERIRAEVMDYTITSWEAKIALEALGLDREGAHEIYSIWVTERNGYWRQVKALREREREGTLPLTKNQLKLQGIHAWFLRGDVSHGRALWRLGHTGMPYRKAEALLKDWEQERKDRLGRGNEKGEAG